MAPLRIPPDHHVRSKGPSLSVTGMESEVIYKNDDGRKVARDQIVQARIRTYAELSKKYDVQ